MPLNLFYTMVQKSQKWPKTQIKGGPALTSGLGIIWAVTFSTHCSEQKKVINLRGLNQVNSTWKKRTSTRCCNRLDNKNIPCIIRTGVSLNAWNFLPYLSQQYM